MLRFAFLLLLLSSTTSIARFMQTLKPPASEEGVWRFSGSFPSSRSLLEEEEESQLLAYLFVGVTCENGPYSFEYMIM